MSESSAPLTLGGLVSTERTIAAVAVAMGTFMQVLDTTIANVSIPTIAGDLGVSADQGTWVITSFAVSNGIAVPLTGWFMARFGLVRTYVAALALFTLASFLCGVAWSLPSLILFRVLQGFFSGPLVPGSQALLLNIFPPNKRATALAVWSITTLVAPIVGPILGGYISDNYSWPWIFLINLPIGIISASLCYVYLGKRDVPPKKIPVDVIGISLLIVWVGALQILLDKGKDADWFNSTEIVILAIIAFIGFGIFMIWELFEKHPIIDFSVMKSRNFVLGMLVNSLGYALFFANLLLFPLWLQTNLNYTATWAGFVAMPSGIVAVLLTPFVGKMLGKSDARIFAAISLACFGLSFFMRANLTTQASLIDFVMPALVQGAGMAMFFMSTVTIMLYGLDHHKIPQASGLSNFVRITAGSFAASVVTSFWDNHAAFHQTRLVERTDSGNPLLSYTLDSMREAGLQINQAWGLIARTVRVEAYAKSAFDFYWISGWLAFALIILLWFARSTKGASTGPVAAD
jgi:MFS transporter, DHA2 family, multidrug resistance protein